jgi:hypothetical protein
MKKIFLISLLSLLIVSCKTSKHAGCDAYSLNKQFSNDTLTRSEKIIQSVNEDLRIVDTWTEEERAYFYEHFVFSYKELEEKVGLKLK